MKFAIPSSKSKRYLSGADWVIAMLDRAMKAETCSGNSSQVVLALDARLNEESLRARLSQFLAEFPVVCGRIARDINLAPYWKFDMNSTPALELDVHETDGDFFTQVLPILERSVNRPFSGENQHITFHYIRAGVQASYFAMTFDHRLLDARGAEAFLELFNDYCVCGGEIRVVDGICLTKSAGLDEWMNKFRAGQKLNRKFIAMSNPTPVCLPIPKDKDKGFRFRLITFDREESAGIFERAAHEAGYLLEMPYLLSTVIPPMDSLFNKRGMSSPQYLVPVTVDLRADSASSGELFFNYVSYLLFKLGPQDRVDSVGLIGALKTQMYEQVKDGTPRNIAQASYLTRIAPLSFLSMALNLPFKGKLASLCFAHLGRGAYRAESFMGASVSNIFHMPRVPVPPGIGFFFNISADRLNLVISVLDGMLDDDELAGLERDIKQRLTR